MAITTILLFLTSLIIYFITKSISLLSSTVPFLLQTCLNFISSYGFALSPIPSYLPQLLSLLRYQQQQRKNDDVCLIMNTTTTTSMVECHASRVKKRKTSDFEMSYNHEAQQPFENKVVLEEEEEGNNNDLENHHHKNIHNNGNHKNDVVGGMSLYSIYILLISHVLRLIYFSKTAKATTEEDSSSTPHDLIMQSIIMVLMQFLLWYYTTTMMATTTMQYQKKKNESSSFSFYSLIRKNHELCLFGCFFFFVTIYVQLFSFSSPSESNENNNQQHNSLQLLLQFSIFLESNLALPQFLQNYQTKSTKNLSLIMIFNWMIGDCFKAAYFVISGGEEGNDRWLFIVGSLYSFVMDIMVWIQCVHWYPNGDTMKRIEWIQGKFGGGNVVSKIIISTTRQKVVVLGGEDEKLQQQQGKIHAY